MSTLPSVNKYTASLCNSLNGAVYNPSGTLWASDFHVLVQSSLEKLCFIVHKRIWYFLCQSIYILIFSDSNTWSISFCFYILARELFDILIKPTLTLNSFSVEDIPDISEMTICLWLKIGAGWSSSSNKRMYLVSYDVDAPNTLKTNSFFLGLDDSKSLIFGIGTEAQPW